MSMDPRDLPPLPELMIAGPGELHEEDLAALGHQVIAHYGDVWVELHGQVLSQLGELLGCRDLPYLIPGTGTTCLDAALFNLFEPGQRVVVPDTGFFGTRLVELARQHRLDVVELDVEVGAPIDVDALSAKIGDADG
ncbi:MAG: alanine-glyoxylate transaminase / serine-glyoxylate transaminase / serine-pyruvate transaminase, partial [Actinomycetota bacterium]|nr:alanine-glyoxylate transaminase / serine-glyoxylate transaminase / serine-pyruvate transaminase [Actinomycetota bacterium]